MAHGDRQDARGAARPPVAAGQARVKSLVLTPGNL
jgi:hypothetical protein